MEISPFAYRKTYPLPGGFSAEFTFDGGQLACGWEPRMPNPKQARDLIGPYREARDQFVADLAADLGVVVAILEI